MDDQSKYDLIERYLAGEMTAAERQDFEQKLAADLALQDELQLHEQVTETLRGEKIHEFRNVLQTVDNQWKKPTEKSSGGKILGLNFRRVLAVAAAVALLIFAWQFFFLMSGGHSLDALFAKEFEPYQMVLNQRSGGESPEKTALFNTAIRQYAGGQFTEAAIAFRQLHASEPDNVAYQFYQAMSLLAGGEAASAIPVFEEILNTPNHLFLEQSRWYLALAYLKNGEKAKAAATFESIKSGEFKYGEAAAFLEKLK